MEQKQISTKLPTLTDFRKAGIKVPVAGTIAFQKLLWKLWQSTIPVTYTWEAYDRRSGRIKKYNKVLTEQVRKHYTFDQVKKFLVKAAHATHADSTKGKATRGYYHRIKPAKDYRTMGKFRGSMAGRDKTRL